MLAHNKNFFPYGQLDLRIGLHKAQNRERIFSFFQTEIWHAWRIALQAYKQPNGNKEKKNLYALNFKPDANQP